MKASVFPFLLFVLTLFAGCGDDGGGEQSGLPSPKSVPGIVSEPVSPGEVPEPIVPLVEEVDQSQEYYKKGHVSSFSHVTKRNWFSYEAGKTGILTRISLYGRPHFRSDIYGDSMQGSIRTGGPSGPVLGKWTLSRDEVSAQLKNAGLTDNDYGWINVTTATEEIV